MLDNILKNWTTSLPAVLVAICTMTMLAEILPPQYYKYLMAFCGFMTAIGFLASKSSNVHSTPVEVSEAAKP